MKTVVLLSGGIDSTTLLYKLAREQGINNVYALSFDYGQRHKKELKMAQKTCKKLRVNHKLVDVTPITPLLQGSALTTKGIEVPEGHYENESMRLTMVPNRNMIFLSLAIGYAISIKSQDVYYAAQAGDRAIYPDCRKEFVAAMKQVAKLCGYNEIRVHAPFLYLTKADIVKLGNKLGIDYSLTWTCYKGKEKACGKCGSCVERLEAFRKAGAKDPLKYLKYER